MATGNWQRGLADGNWQLATGGWQLATGYWRLATGNGGWLMATGYWLPFSVFGLPSSPLLTFSPSPLLSSFAFNL